METLEFQTIIMEEIFQDSNSLFNNKKLTKQSMKILINPILTLLQIIHA